MKHDAAGFCCQALSAIASADLPPDIHSRLLQQLCHYADVRYAAFWFAEKGAWHQLSESGPGESIDFDMLSDCLDQQDVVRSSPWWVSPSGPQSVVAAWNNGPIDSERFAEAAQEYFHAKTLVDIRQQTSERVQQLQSILDISATWRQIAEMDDLLHKMAEASTSLLECERASIFLWDRPNKTLVGRPALGVDGNELRIPDDAGVVGQVVQSGETRRVTVEEADNEFDQSVDAKLGFQTRTILCCPLQNQDGERLGAFEVLNKTEGTFTTTDEMLLKELAQHAAVALENTQQLEQLIRMRKLMSEEAASGVQLIGESPSIEALRSTVQRVADTELAILILGENGTGKEVISQMVHYLSRRRDEPFVAVNCAALTETLLESELFGHEKGAFTDARETRIGKFELASGGTLFLDEIGDMSLGGQAKLLRVLEEKVVVRVGGSTPIYTDVRVVAATNQNLAEKVTQKQFRQDLYFRLNVVKLDLPPLRDRDKDVILLANYFLGMFCQQAKRAVPSFTKDAQKRLLQHRWPGNVRELRNLMERVAYLSSGDKIDVDDLAFVLSPEPSAGSQIPDDQPLTDATNQFQTEYIRKHINKARGNMTDAAKRLGLHRSNLYRKMRQLGMEEE